MQKELKLTDFQLNLLAELIAKRQNAQADESQFVGMCLSSAGHNPMQDKIDLKDGKLIWSEVIEIPPIEPETK